MVEDKVKWQEGDGYIIATSSGMGNNKVTLTTDGPNEGLDREQVVTLETTRGPNVETAQVLMKQKGWRQRVLLADGKLLVTADNRKFNVLKQ